MRIHPESLLASIMMGAAIFAFCLITIAMDMKKAAPTYPPSYASEVVTYCPSGMAVEFPEPLYSVPTYEHCTEGEREREA